MKVKEYVFVLSEDQVRLVLDLAMTACDEAEEYNDDDLYTAQLKELVSMFGIINE